jgi:hypothetical protein
MFSIIGFNSLDTLKVEQIGSGSLCFNTELIYDINASAKFFLKTSGYNFTATTRPKNRDLIILN